MKPTVYLAGPITGMTFNESETWRTWAIRELADNGIVGLSPMRSEGFLAKYGKLEKQYEGDSPMVTPAGITTRDRFDVANATVMLAYFPPGVERASIGTCVEFGWADAFRTPVVGVYEKGNLHDHGILNHINGFHTESLEEGLQLVVDIIGPRSTEFYSPEPILHFKPQISDNLDRGEGR